MLVLRRDLRSEHEKLKMRMRGCWQGLGLRARVIKLSLLSSMLFSQTVCDWG